MIQTVDLLMEHYGSSLRLCRDGEATEFKAFLQPVTSKSWQNMERLFGGLGEIPRGQYLYLGPRNVCLSAGDELETGEQAYIVRKAETLMLEDKPLYLWALCVRKGGDDPWNV